MTKNNKKICVVGASGLVGSSIVRYALERGYFVHGTLTDKSDITKVKYLKKLKNSTNLELFSAKMENEKDFINPMGNADAVFIACLIPTYKGKDGTPAKEMDDKRGYQEIINPTVNGCLNIIKAAKNKGIKNIIICSSTSSTNPVPPMEFKNEIEHWSDEKEQCKAKKYTSATKTVMEKMAIRYCEENDIRLSIILPTGLYGDPVLPIHLNHNPFIWLKRVIEGGSPRHEKIPNDSASMIHLRDLAKIFLAVYENPSASGRYFGVYKSLHWEDIYNECKKLIPNMKMPQGFSETPVKPTTFDFTRRGSLNVKIRDFSSTLKETVDWLKTNPFSEEIGNE